MADGKKESELTKRTKKKAVRKTKTQKRKSPTKKQPSPGRDEKGLFLPGNKIAEKWTEEKVLDIGKQLIEWMKESVSNFWFEDFLIEHDLYDDFVSNMSERFPRFREYITRAKKIQESRITKIALMGDLDSGMARWVLSVHHGKRDVQETKTELSGGVNVKSDRFSLTIENN